MKGKYEEEEEEEEEERESTWKCWEREEVEHGKLPPLQEVETSKGGCFFRGKFAAPAIRITETKWGKITRQNSSTRWVASLGRWTWVGFETD